MENSRAEFNMEEAVRYFQKSGFYRLFQGMLNRYNSLSRLGGTIVLDSITCDEAETLEGFLQLQCKAGQSLTIQVALIRRRLKKTRFGEVELELLVPAVLGLNMVSRKEGQELYESERHTFFQGILEHYAGTRAGEWLSLAFRENNTTLSSLYQDYKQNRAFLEQDFMKIMEGFNRLPVFQNEKLLISVYAAQTSGDPHFFDENKRSLYYLLRGIGEILGGESSFSKGADARTELLYKAGILRDDLSNYVLSYGIQGYEATGRHHEGMEQYLIRQEPLLLTLRNLSMLESAGTVTNQVFIMENPSAFDHLIRSNPDNIACICSAGQPKLSLIILLDLLVKNKTTLYYAGDFDPEGLGIAQRLKNRYGSNLIFWKYSREIYLKARSKITLSNRRLRQLDSITDEALCRIAECIRMYGVAGYQENILEEYR